MFKVGQKVVCIEDFMPNGCTKLPIKNEIYTVREIVTIRDPCLRLKEIFNPIFNYNGYGYMEAAYNALGFRPVDTTFGEQVCESLEVTTEPELV